MRFHRVGFLAWTWLFVGCTETPNHTLVLNGDDWEFTEINENPHWERATVPGTVQTDLLVLGKIPNPLVGTNEDSIQWISERDWQYRKEFEISSEVLQKKRHLLQFDGLDTYAEVRFNDSLLLTTNNAFRNYRVDVSGVVQAVNELSITFRSTSEKEQQLAGQLAYQLPEAPRVFTRKPQFHYGWDWGPTIKTMGIWRDVTLVSFNEANFTDVFFETVHIADDRAQLRARLEVETADVTNATIEIINNTTGETFSAKDVEINHHDGNEWIAMEIEIENPKLWWTHNLGEPFLYDFTVQLKKGAVILDEVSQKVGLRTIQLVTKQDSLGESFFFKLNGTPVYMKGANYIPQHIFLPKVTIEDSERLLDDVLAANMNMLRVWGGGVYENTNFYEQCDEKGILLWQDFMFACAMYPGDSKFLDNVKAEAIANVKRLRKHPSIALWCGNNENSEGWHRWGWQEGKTEAQKEEIWSNYQALFNDLLPKVVDSLHPSVSYWESSPKFGRGDERYQREGDAHDWWVWHDGYPFEHFESAVPRFMSEFGFQAYPSMEAVRHLTQQEQLDLTHPALQTHQKHSRGFELIRTYMERDFPVPTNPEAYIYVSQLLQAYGITKGIKAHRRAKPYNMGTLYWQLNDCWPAVSWSSIDGLGNWKALHYKAKTAFKNRLVIPWVEENTLKVAVVEDYPNTVKDSMYVEIKDFFGKVLYRSESKEVETFVDKNEVIYEVALDTINFDPQQSFAEVYFGREKAVHYMVPPKALQLPSETLEISQIDSQHGSTFRVKSHSLQKDVFLIADVPGHFSDNFFDLLPGETKTIQFTPKKKPLQELRFITLNGLLEKGQLAIKNLKQTP